ncbi:MAG: regulatory iron-sulfur-containing complex subunit RicT [Planctomycetota bacterium]
MPIVPLPQFEADLAEYLKEKEDREAYERLNAPTTIVVRFGAMKMVGEFPYDGEAKPGCGSKLVVRTHRGEELGEMLTSTCPNAGCSKSVTRREMLEYIENSGGKDYPFFDGSRDSRGVKGRVLRIATKQDLDAQAAIEAARRERITQGRGIAEAVGFGAKVVDVEPILGGGHVSYYYFAEERIDHGRFLAALKERHAGERVELRQIGARDEARLTADYERCGQHCCCKNFLKVLKPVSMRSAKVQKATLDPLKISGRCGRLMCCLRYEDATYKELKKNLPHRKSRVGTPHGDGIVIDSQILTQLVLIELDNRERVAVPVEELTEPVAAQAPVPHDTRSKRPAGERPPRRGDRAAQQTPKPPDATKQATPKRKQRPKPSGEKPPRPGASGPNRSVGRRRKPKPAQDTPQKPSNQDQQQGKPKRRRRRKNLGENNRDGESGGGPSEKPPGDGSGPSGSGG